MKKNYKYIYDKKANDGFGGYTRKVATKTELEKSRKKAEKLTKNGKNIGMRSCWVCNGAHAHFLNGWGDWVLACFVCGHWYYDGVDITIYE